MPLTRAMVKGSAQHLSGVGRGDGRKRKDNTVALWLDRNDHPLMNDVVLGTLFEYVQVKDLKSCRLVSKKWNISSIPFVRSSLSVSISGTNITCHSPEIKGVQYFVQLMITNTLGIPFTKYRLGTFDTTIGAGQEFFQLCGKTATSIIFNDDDVHMIENIAQVLRSSPKLEYLVLPEVMTSKNRKRKAVKLFPEDIKPKLPFLKSVNVETETRENPTEIIKKYPTFYEEIFEVAENISTLDLTSFSSKLGLKILETIEKFGKMKSIKNLKFIHRVGKTLPPEYFDLLKGLKLKHLDLEFSLFGPDSVDWFELVELSRNTLTSLYMRCYFFDPTTLMNFQPMPKLKELKLVICAISNPIPSSNNISHIFPSLEKLHLHFAVIDSTGNEFNSLVGDEGSPCPNMKSLTLMEYTMEMETLNRILTIFPSLKVFKCEITEGEVMKGIWTHMTQLEDLSICGTLESTENLDSLFTGIPVGEINIIDMKGFMDSLEQQDVEVRREQILLETNKHSQLPSIRNLTNLRALEIDLYTKKSRGRKSSHLTDVTGYLGFYSLKNLRHLSANDCEISKDCMDVLVKDMGLHTWGVVSSCKIRGRNHSFKFESN